MSAFGASVGRAVGGLGGPATTTILVVAGVAAGALGGGLYAGGAFSGGGQPAGAAGKLSVYPCPDTGPVIATVQAGQQVLATGRSEDSTWLRIHFPAPGRTEAWVEAGPLTVDGSVASLPVANCEPELAIAPPSGDLPEESLTAVLANPPTDAPPTATPTATPTTGPTPNPRPALASLTASTRQVSFDTGNYCPNAVKRVTFRVKATDTGGVADVTLFWREPGAAAFAQSAMNRVSGSPTNGTWEVTLDTAANGIDKAGNLAYFAVARDIGGATRRIPANGSDTIQVKVCVNEGPTVTAVSQPSGALFWDPLGAGNCQTALNFVATVRDTDGLQSVSLFYRKPGSGAFQSKPMNNTTIKGKWYANLDSLGDKIPITSPPTDVLRWYVRATDRKGLATTMPAKEVTVRRCDTEATFFVNNLANQGQNYCPEQGRPNVQIPFTFSITDPDEMVSATLSYTITSPAGVKISRKTTVQVSNGRFNIQSVPIDGQSHNGFNNVTWTITTKDRYGGTSADSSKGTYQIWGLLTMPALGAILPKVLVFGASMVVGAAVASVAVTVLQQDSGPVTGATDTKPPQYVLAGADTPAGPGPVVAFNEEPAPASEAPPTEVPTLSPEDLNAAAEDLLGGGPQDVLTPATFNDPTGFPRIRPITQFDGGDKEGSNCTLASGAMLARLARGIVTSGTVLRGLQDDQDGGTGVNDLDTALFRGYGVTFPYGLLRPQQLKDLLAAGYGAVIQGLYGEIPGQIRLQKDFTGGHAIYLDGYYPGNPARGIPEAYFVIDPLGRPHGGYQGDWWPASIVDDFAVAWGGGRIAAMWAFPPGGVPPDVVGPDVLPIPKDPVEPVATPTPEPTATPTASESPEVSPSATVEPTATPTSTSGTGFPPIFEYEPGSLTVDLPPPAKPPVGGGKLGGLDVFPVFDFCLINPALPSCPHGLPAVFPAGSPPILQFPLGPTVDVLFVDSDRANQVMVGFTVDPPATADVKFWVQGATPGVVGHASAMSTLDLFGSTVTMARLDVKAATTYEFQVVAGDGIFAGYSEIGTFTTGSGVEAFSVALSSVTSPVFGIGSGLSPYTKQAPDTFLYPMVRIADLGTAACGLRADFGGTDYCLDQRDLGPASKTCVSADVTYELAGIDGDSVYIRAFPTVEGTTSDGDLTLDGVYEATGPNGAGTARVGCLGAGITYTITIDAVGDDRGVLATQDVDIP